MNKPDYCAITEQGDLGLGANVLNPEEQKVVEEQANVKVPTNENPKPTLGHIH